MLIPSFQQQNPFYFKNTMSSFIFFILWFLKVARTFTGLPRPPSAFRLLESQAHIRSAFLELWCLFALHKPKGQNPHLSGTFISWGKKRKPSFRFLLTLGKWASCPGRNEMNDKCRVCLCWLMELRLALRRASPAARGCPRTPAVHLNRYVKSASQRRWFDLW